MSSSRSSPSNHAHAPSALGLLPRRLRVCEPALTGAHPPSACLLLLPAACCRSGDTRTKAHSVTQEGSPCLPLAAVGQASPPCRWSVVGFGIKSAPLCKLDPTPEVDNTHRRPPPLDRSSSCASHDGSSPEKQEKRRRYFPRPSKGVIDSFNPPHCFVLRTDLRTTYRCLHATPSNFKQPKGTEGSHGTIR